MATAATIAAAAIGAAGSIGGAAISSQGAKSAAAAGAPHPEYVHLPGYAAAINREVARALALNMNKVPPSFAEYVDSGGTATFPWTDPGLSPIDLRRLGLMYGSRKKGFKPVPLVSTEQAASGSLNAEQQAFLNQWLKHHGKGRGGHK